MKNILLGLVTIVLVAGFFIWKSRRGETTSSRENTPVEVSNSAKEKENDLSSPEATVISFTKAAAIGNSEQALACFLPGTDDYNDAKETLYANPSSPQYIIKQVLESIDVEKPIQIILQKKTDSGVEIIWRVTFKKGFTLEGKTFKPGDTHDFDAKLTKSGEHWLISDF